MTHVRSMTKVERIARVAHEINRAYCRALGDYSHMSWEEAPEWQRVSAVTGVQAHLEAPAMTPEQSHENWLMHKQNDGWKWGPVKDPDRREHPSFMTYNDLPEREKAKYHLFRAVVQLMDQEIPAGGTVVVDPLPLPPLFGASQP